MTDRTNPDLHTTYMDLELTSPVVASASPLTGSVDSVRALRDAGIGAAVLPSLFEEQLEHDVFANGCTAPPLPMGMSTPSWFSELDTYNTGADHYLNLVERLVAADLGIPIIASINGSTSTTLIRFARQLDEAGADAVEVNLYRLATGIRRPAGEIEDEYIDLVAAIRNAIDIPLAVKIGPWFTALAHTARRLAVAGADGLVLFDRFYQADIDVDELAFVPRLDLSSSDDLLLPLSWITILNRQVPASLAASSGVHTADDVIKVMLAGGRAAMMTSALLQHGPDHVAGVLSGVRHWLDDHGYGSLAEIQGLLSLVSVARTDVDERERTEYLRTLTSYQVD